MLPAVRVELAGEQHIPSLVALHRSVLSDTLNARLGTRHLARLYREMMHSDISVVAVALSGDEVVGGTTATIDIHEQRRRMIRATPITEFPVLAINVAFHPGCISDLWEMLYPEVEPLYRGHTVRGDFTTLVVSDAHRRRGIGRALANFVEAFFRSRNCDSYRYAPRRTNLASQQLVRGLGGEEVCTYGRDTIFVRKLA
jgi:ribosomal protein S18 acetylase RimI-like enzyme